MVELVHNDAFWLKTVLLEISEAKTLPTNYDLTHRVTIITVRFQIPSRSFLMDTESPSVSRIATWCLVLGGIFAALGTLAVMTPWVAAKVVAVFCGITLLVAGFSQIAMAIGTYTWRGFWITLVCGGLSTMAGIGMLVLPEAGVEALVLFLGFLLAFEAVAKLAAAFTVREGFPWGWLLLDGIITSILSVILLTSSPLEAGMLLGIFIGINFLSSAVAFIAAGLHLRKIDVPS